MFDTSETEHENQVYYYIKLEILDYTKLKR